MKKMRLRHFLKRIDHEQLHEAIAHAEKGTTGDIVVYISSKPVPDALAAANEEFRRLELETIKAKNNLLIFLAPKSQTFAVIGGTALHEKVGQVWWDKLVAHMAHYFKAGDYMGGLLEGVRHAGQVMRRHFPANGATHARQHDVIEE
jgi:uncharacterized membrane protein